MFNCSFALKLERDNLRLLFHNLRDQTVFCSTFLRDCCIGVKRVLQVSRDVHLLHALLQLIDMVIYLLQRMASVFFHQTLVDGFNGFNQQDNPVQLSVKVVPYCRCLQLL